MPSRTIKHENGVSAFGDMAGYLRLDQMFA
jgi:hypothetical protein